MTVAIGTRLGSYEITGAIGAGGMGGVFRARDTRLHRDVAIKVLPELFATDPERLTRFEREATTLASLNHPNIAQIYGLESVGATGERALVMELVEGETLAERVSRGPVPIDEALPIARQIADALEAAHDCGIIHRDLKPANIKVRPDGTVKVLDFGLAKSIDPSGVLSGVDAANSPTFTSPAATGIGVILRTAAYMAPEQARGKAVDSRADIWAFGVTVYEMHTGKPLFAGASVSEVLASILRDGPNWETLPHDTPASVRTLLRRCLQKDPQLRLRHAGDARLELTDADLSPPPPATAPRGPLSWTGAALFGIAVAAVSLVTALLVVTRFQKAPELPVRKWIIPQESGDDVFGRENVPAISPDGRRVAYTDGERLRIRDLTSFDPREVQVAGTAGMPGWSPDGEFVAFFTDHKYLAYMSDETGTDEIFVRSFPEGHGKRQVSTDGGWWPRWRGTEIFFVEKTTLMAASVRTTPSLQVDAPKALFRLEDRARTGRSSTRSTASGSSSRARSSHRRTGSPSFRTGSPSSRSRGLGLGSRIGLERPL